MPKEYYAHSLENKPVETWQKLSDHLLQTAALAKKFAKPFQAEYWAYIAGLNHDIGKGALPFQSYLLHANNVEDEELKPYYAGRIDHSSKGAQQLYDNSRQGGKLLAYCVAGHHSGLPNWIKDSAHGLKYRLEKTIPPVMFTIKDEIEFPQKLPLANLDANRFGFQLQFFTRMIFSCLVDADYLDTEKFISPEMATYRGQYPELKNLHDSFWSNFNNLRKRAKLSSVNTIRERVLTNCLKKAVEKPGLFSLTVPTGGGKTLSSLAFALNHALKHGKRRIIYVIPFTSIIEQNAKVMRNTLGDDCVLEHHSNFTPDDTDWKTRLSAENWDVPIVVTTNVQFFDSFYSNKTSKCRKLHNVADSVVIFDEIQAIPVEKLNPCIEVLRELTLNYGVTAVLCTATQPALTKSKEFENGLEGVREIISDVPSLFKSLRRTRQNFIGKLGDDDVAKLLRDEKQVLCVVSTRKKASELFNRIRENGDAFHLSALMYPVHRSRVLDEIRSRLHPENHESCRLVSTQLIEAGVDVDFPVVFRSLAGMDSIAQSAGRCNREGRMGQGDVFVFEPEDGIPAGYFRQTAQCAKRLLERFPGKLIEPECIREYFLDYYWVNRMRMDDKDIVGICSAGQAGDIQFEDISSFRMIESANIPIIIALEDKSVDLVEKLVAVKYPGAILRKLQQFSVQVYPNQLDSLRDWLENPYPGVYALRTSELYSNETGLVCAPPECHAFFG